MGTGAAEPLNGPESQQQTTTAVAGRLLAGIVIANVAQSTGLCQLQSISSDSVMVPYLHTVKWLPFVNQRTCFWWGKRVANKYKFNMKYAAAASPMRYQG